MESSKIDYAQFKFPKGKVNKQDNKSCLKTILKRNKPIKRRTSKQNKLEKERDKNLVKSGRCEYCGKLCGKLDSHEVYGGSNRKRSIKKRICKTNL